MHDIDRIRLETQAETGMFEAGPFEAEQFEFAQAETPYGETGEVFSETEQTELASDLLEVASEAEFDRFLGDLIGRAGQAIGKFVRSPEGQAIGGILPLEPLQDQRPDLVHQPRIFAVPRESPFQFPKVPQQVDEVGCIAGVGNTKDLFELVHDHQQAFGRLAPGARMEQERVGAAAKPGQTLRPRGSGIKFWSQRFIQFGGKSLNRLRTGAKERHTPA